MKDRRWYPWLLAGAVLAATAILWAAGHVARGQAPGAAEPTFKPAAIRVEDGDLWVRFKATYPAGMQGTWDPEAIRAGVARLVTVLDGVWRWTPYTPTLSSETPPVPPIPPVPPVPPVPTTGLNVALIGPEPRVMRQLTPAQVAILTSRPLRSYLEANCEKDDDGITPAFRVLIRSNDNSALSPRWKSILAKAPTDGCILAAVNGERFSIAPLPADVAAVLKILSDLTGRPADPIVVREFPRLRVIPDDVWEKYNPPGRVAVVDGERRYLSARPRDWVKQPRGRPLADYGVNLIPRSEWPERIAALKAANAGLMSLTYVIPPYDQGQTNYCWCNAVAQGMTALGYEQGRPLLIYSAASIGGPITNYRNVGGWGGDAVDFAQKTGAVRASLWPNNAISRSYFAAAEVQADYPRNRITVQIADLGETGRMFDEVATCVLLGAPVAAGYDWWGHEVLAVGLAIENGKPYLIFRNSWGQYEDNGFFLLPEGNGRNKGTPDDAQAILSMLAA